MGRVYQLRGVNLAEPARLVCPEEGLGDPRSQRRRDAGSLIRDRNRELVPRLLDRQRDGGGAALAGVLDQVPDRAPDEAAVRNRGMLGALGHDHRLPRQCRIVTRDSLCSVGT